MRLLLQPGASLMRMLDCYQQNQFESQDSCGTPLHASAVASWHFLCWRALSRPSLFHSVAAAACCMRLASNLAYFSMPMLACLGKPSLLPSVTVACGCLCESAPFVRPVLACARQSQLDAQHSCGMPLHAIGVAAWALSYAGLL